MGRKAVRHGIAHWPASERPRERLLAQGADALTDAQLLAILLRVGRQRSSAVQVSMEVLDRLGGIAGLAHCGIEELCAVPADIISTGPDREETIVMRHPYDG